MNRLHPSDLFLVAAARLDRADWWTGDDLAPVDSDDDAGPVNLIGALSYAASGEPRNPDAAAGLCAHLVDFLDLDTRPHPVDAVGDWMDGLAEPKKASLDVLDNARERLEPTP